MGDSDITSHHSLCSPSRTPKISTQTVCKSDIHLNNHDSSDAAFRHNTRQSCGEYYKRYDLDETPVRDSSSHTEDSGRISLTSLDIDKLENKLCTGSEHAEDDTSNKSLDSNIKFFKTTVQQIFDNFYTSMQDFELYKKKFHEILARNNAESLSEMEDFITDMIQHIMSSETSVTKESKSSTELSYIDIDKDKTINFTSIDSDVTASASGKLLENLHSVVEAYKNENYTTDSQTPDGKASKAKHCSTGEIFNIYLLNSAKSVEIKMHDRTLFSEINLKDPISSGESRLASADNLKKVAAKRLELEEYGKQSHQDSRHTLDREIPIKVSFAKKNIHLNEDFLHRDDEDKSFIFKICNYLCKKFRKTYFS